MSTEGGVTSGFDGAAGSVKLVEVVALTSISVAWSALSPMRIRLRRLRLRVVPVSDCPL